MFELNLAILCMFLLLVFFFVMAIVVRYRKRVRESVMLRAEFEKLILQTQLEIQEQTLKTISQEIHDNIGQVLSLAKLNLNTIKSIEDQQYQDTKGLLSKAIADLRDLSRSMQGDRITTLGLEQSVSEEMNILKSTGQFDTRLRVLGTPYRLERQKEIILFRIVQEAFSNIIKHADAKTVEVVFDYEPKLFKLSITDDGIGREKVDGSSTRKGIGLVNMNSRTTMMGGSFSFQQGNGQGGSSVKIEIPISDI
jgi:two-component system, NarL family, sensor kinase